MNRFLLAGLCLLMTLRIQAQSSAGSSEGDFLFADIPPAAFAMTTYEKDTSADAVVLDEFGRTDIDNSEKNILIHFHHIRIKILNDRGIGYATFEIPAYKAWSGDGAENVYDIKASTFNKEDGEVHVAVFRPRDVFTENKSRTLDLVKFTLPDVKAGSVIDVEYRLSSPFIRNFREWEFQSDIPKIHSEYWARIPANLEYNISLIGYLKLSEDKRELIRDCLTTFNGGKADCTLMKLAMKDIPAFKEEKYMTARSNYLSAVHFELSSLHGFDGSVRNFANTWDDLEKQLLLNKDFGIQLKRGPALLRDQAVQLTRKDSDDLSRARSLYRFFQTRYRWDGYTGFFCEKGIKKALDGHSGNIADINLSLIAALRSIGLSADPVLISTRENGVPKDLFPSVTDFNYVLVGLLVNGKQYLIDASRPELPFGIFPLDCVNGKGRIIYQNKPSDWVSIKASANFNERNVAYLTIDATGGVSGSITRTYEGYTALSKRREIKGYGDPVAYLDHINNQWSGFTVTADTVRNLDNPDQPLIETCYLSLNQPVANQVMMNPFFASLKENPFQSAERHFPVDFGATERVYSVVTLQYPGPYNITALPRQVNLVLPDQGGRYVVQTDSLTNMVIVKTLLQQSKPTYGASEYTALKRFYNLIIQSQRADMIFSKN